MIGCVVNGPGEADLGCGVGQRQGPDLRKGQVIKTAPEHQIVETLIEEAMRIAEEAGESAETGSPTVTVG